MQFCPDKAVKLPENGQLLDVISSTVIVYVCVTCDYALYTYTNVYVVKEVVSYWGLGQLTGKEHNRMCT